MDPFRKLSRLPAVAALLQIPWFILLSIARVRLGGTSARFLVKLVDILIPLPAFAGVLIASVLLFRARGRGGIWLWCGALACGAISTVFLAILLG